MPTSPNRPPRAGNAASTSPKHTTTAEAVRAAARAGGPRAVASLLDVMCCTDASPAARLAAAHLVLDYACGRPRAASAQERQDRDLLEAAERDAAAIRAARKSPPAR